MIRVFFDASALFSGIYSVQGAAFALMVLAGDDALEIVVSEDVVEEVWRNLLRKVPTLGPTFYHFLLHSRLIYMDPDESDVIAAAGLTAPKDVHVVAGANASKCHYIVSHDRAHLVGNKAIETALSIRVVTPGTLLEIIRTSSSPTHVTQQRED